MYSQNKYFYVCDRQILNPGLRTLYWWFVAWCQVQCCLFRTKSWDAAQVNLAKHTSDLQHIRIWVNFLALCIQYPFTVAWWGTSHCCIALLILLPWLQGQSYLCSMMMVGWSCYTQRKKLGCLSFWCCVQVTSYLYGMGVGCTSPRWGRTMAVLKTYAFSPSLRHFDPPGWMMKRPVLVATLIFMYL